MIGRWAVGEATAGRILGTLPLPQPTVTAPTGVYWPSVDSALLCRRMVNHMQTHPKGVTSVIELCAGSGIASVYAALAGARVTAVDDTRESVEAVAVNAASNDVTVDVVRSDVRALPRLDPADLVVANPPYVPAPAHMPDGHAWNAGPNGRSVVDSIIGVLPELVRPAGAALLVQSDVCGVTPTLSGLADRGFDAAVTDEVVVDFGPVMHERALWLESQGFIDPGERTERVVVIRAVRSTSAVPRGASR